MEDLIFDCYSVFWQIAVYIFGDVQEVQSHYETMLACYIMAGVMLLLVLFALLRIVSAFARMVLTWFSRGV